MDSDVGIYIGIGLAGYLLGSFPTAYIVVQHFSGKNILDHGTGNVGMMNTHRATNSRSLTLLVLAGDMLKGALALPAGVLLGPFSLSGLGGSPRHWWHSGGCRTQLFRFPQV